MSNRVLYVSHNHPSVRPGGAEGYALALHRAMRSTPNWESLFLAHAGPPLTSVRRYHEGALLALDDGASDEYYCYNEFAAFDTFNGRSTDKNVWTYISDFLRAFTPDVVHFQHTLFFGYDMIREVRNTLPNATILYTLHDFIPICNQHGQMLRTINDDQLCTHSSPRRCHECFPNHTPQAFFMRKRYIQAMLELVDLFIAPSEFLRQRYIEWGVAPERIRYEENGCAHDVPQESMLGEDDQRLRNRLGYFGQLNRFKGIHVLLDAMQLLQKEQVDAHLWIHGANLDLQSVDFQQQVADLVAGSSDKVTLAGRYEQGALPRLMAEVDWVIVPSIWWENSPLVIQEAFLHGRPVICSDIGGMAEKVTDGVNGLHFNVRDAVSLARALRHATTTPGLWNSLQQGIPKVNRMDEHVGTMTQLYLDLIASKRHSASADVVRL
jgi:glycosyltransferase involved in cell wall biosynthesis